jgi:hypothetical protein
MESISPIHECSLVREAQGGNHAAFAQLVHIHDEAVLRLALRIQRPSYEWQSWLERFRPLKLRRKPNATYKFLEARGGA